RRVLFRSGNPVASVTVTATREEIEGKQAVRSLTEMGGMASLRQEVVFEAANLRPLFLKTEQQMGPNTVSIDLRVEGGKVVGTIALPGAEPRNVSVDVIEGMLLPGMDDYAIMVAELGPGVSFSVPMLSGRTGTISNY